MFSLFVFGNYEMPYLPCELITVEDVLNECPIPRDLDSTYNPEEIQGCNVSSKPKDVQSNRQKGKS